MNYNLASLIHMVFGRKKNILENDMERGEPQPSPASAEPQIHVDHQGRPEIAPDDQLNLFRHLTGITSHPSMVHSHLERGGRAAPNLGIYARVVHNEQDAKRGYKRFSWLINGCLGLQIVVAAALTAMGAAGASHSAVTVFGAINTVIAGLLTFLKGSGLPNRLKYYQAEWKRVREFIEQRERDFSRPSCDLDVYGVVAMIEKMYDEVKMDLEASVPDRFAGFRTGQKGNQQFETTTKPASLLLPRIGTEGLNEKVKELESGFGNRVRDLTSEIRKTPDVVREATRDLQEQTDIVMEDASRIEKEQADKAARLESSFINKLKDLASEIGNKAHLAREAVQYLQAHGENIVQEGAKETGSYAEQVEQPADR
jgi:hypothetical protein